MDINNLPESITYYDLNEAWAALKQASDKMIKEGELHDNDIMTSIGNNYSNIADKFHRIMKHMSGQPDRKMILVDPVKKEVFDYAFKETLKIS